LVQLTTIINHTSGATTLAHPLLFLVAGVISCDRGQGCIAYTPGRGGRVKLGMFEWKRPYVSC